MKILLKIEIVIFFGSTDKTKTDDRGHDKGKNDLSEITHRENWSTENVILN